MATLNLVKELRERTGAGIMDCKAALQDSGGNLEKAIDTLRKKGVAQAAKRAGREAREGLVAARVEGRKAAMVEANCETDFVARTEDFRGLVNLVLDEAMKIGQKAAESSAVQDRLAELTAKIGEKMVVRRVKIVETAGGFLFSYIHSNHKLGVIVELEASGGGANAAALSEAGRDVAMQVAASSPTAIVREGVAPDVIEREKAIFHEEAKTKPAPIAEKIVNGKLEKFFQTACLLEQPFIRDDKLSVREYLTRSGAKLGTQITVRQFTRFQLGEAAA